MAIKIRQVACPACAKGVTTQRDTHVFRRVYLCDDHKAKWDAAESHAQRYVTR